MGDTKIESSNLSEEIEENYEIEKIRTLIEKYGEIRACKIYKDNLEKELIYNFQRGEYQFKMDILNKYKHNHKIYLDSKKNKNKTKSNK